MGEAGPRKCVEHLFVSVHHPWVQLPPRDTSEPGSILAVFSAPSPPPPSLACPTPQLTPSWSTVYVTAQPCVKCFTITGLTEGDTVYGQLAARNFLGPGPLALSNAIAMRVPDAPTSVNVVR